ncbi:hypothetical protein LNQ03_24780 [Klebsiella pneumoniae subsp. pneumoniae]|nr:hypothetical protein [Klebsiella pneumoniae subsp. pneumoniae]
MVRSIFGSTPVSSLTSSLTPLISSALLERFALSLRRSLLFQLLQLFSS